MTWNDPSSTPWLAGHEPTSAELIAQVRDNFKAIGDPWTAYTPTLTATTTNPTGQTYAGAYVLAGKLCHFRYKITLAATVGTGTYTIALPVPAVTGIFPHALAQGTVWDSSVGTLYTRTGLVAGGTTTFVLHDNAGARVGATVPVALAAGDVIAGFGTFEAA